jgi:capsular polysaccharide biosynthesis protein
MSLAGLRAVLARRWWVIVLGVATGLGISLAYSSQQAVRYESTVTVFAHPSSALTEPKDQLNELNLLSYGSILQTIADAASSPATRTQLAAGLGLDPRVVKECSTLAHIKPSTTEVLLSITCGSRDAARKLADRLPGELDAVSSSDFRGVISLTRIDDGPSVTHVQPDTERDAVFGAVAGLLIGVVVAVLTAPAVRRRARPSQGTALETLPGDTGAATPEATTTLT